MGKVHTHYVGVTPILHSHKKPNNGWGKKERNSPYPDHHHPDMAAFLDCLAKAVQVLLAEDSAGAVLTLTSHEEEAR